jgi:hypothetical protein
MRQYSTTSEKRSKLHIMQISTPYHQLAEALRERLAVIANRELYSRDPVAHLELLKRASERIIELQKALPPPIAPDLAHYLQRCSYDKALAHIERQIDQPQS